MNIKAEVFNTASEHRVEVSTNGSVKSIEIPPKSAGRGSSANGGELLFLALATCYCNDLFREAAKRNIAVESVRVTVTGEFGKEGEPAKNIVYTADVVSHESKEVIEQLLRHTDSVAEIQNTIRSAIPVTLSLQ